MINETQNLVNNWTIYSQLNIQTNNDTIINITEPFEKHCNINNNYHQRLMLTNTTWINWRYAYNRITDKPVSND